jgi:hypothetical protein
MRSNSLARHGHGGQNVGAAHAVGVEQGAEPGQHVGAQQAIDAFDEACFVQAQILCRGLEGFGADGEAALQGH